MTQQQVTQEVSEQSPEALKHETRRTEAFSDAAITAVEDDRISVNLTKDVLTAEATLIQENGEERKEMAFSEEEVEQSHTVQLERSTYARFRATPWELLQNELLQDDREQITQEDAVHTPVMSAWDIISTVHKCQQPALDSTMIRHTVAVPAEDTFQQSVDAPEPETSPLTVTDTSADHISPRGRSAVSWDYEIPDRPEQTYEYRNVQRTEDAPVPTIDMTEPYQTAEGTIEASTAPADEELLDALFPDTRPYEGSPEADFDSRDRILVDVIESEDGGIAHLRYQVDSEVTGEGTVKDTLLELVESGELDATIVQQPFYSPESFDLDGEHVDAGWQDGFYGVVQMEGMSIDMTEFSYGASPGNLELAQDDINSVELEDGEYVDFEASEKYTCGVARDQKEHREAWTERYGEFDRFDSVTERGVYASLIEGYEFEGSTLDLTLYEDARTAYIEHRGVAPEQQIDNVTYRPS